MATKKTGTKKKAGTKRGKKAPVKLDGTVKKGGDSKKLRLWVNPQGPKFHSVTKLVPEGLVLKGKFTKNFIVRREEVEGPEGFSISSKDLYDWLLAHTDNKGVPFFIAKKPPTPKEPEER